MMNTIVIIAGPTAVGKTDISIEVAKAFGGEIISSDSMQIYKHFDVGSAKPTPEEQARVNHHLIDFVDPKTPFSVSDYQKCAKEKIEDLFKSDKLPVVTGGTGLYANALMYKMDFNQTDSDHDYRAKLEKLYEEEGAEFLHEKLKALDPDAASRIHANNVRRVIRALEVNEVTGMNMKDFQKDPEKTSDYRVILVGLTRNRHKLYARINKRVDLMLEAGLIDEIKYLKSIGLDDSYTSMQGIGYKEVLPYLEGRYDYDTMADLIKLNSRRYAKRQMTWFKRYKDMTWFDIDKIGDTEEVIRQIVKHIKEELKEGDQ